MHCRVTLDRDHAAQIRLDLREHVAFGAAQRFGHLRVDAEDNLVVMVDVFRDAARLGQDFVADRLRAFNHAASAAIRARGAERAFERLLDAFARDGHQAEIVELENLRRRTVAVQLLFEGRHHLLAVLALFHVDEVEHDDPAEVAQPDLADDLFGRFEVGLDDGVFEAVRFADEFAGVDVNRDQGLSLVDDDVPARLQPDARFDGLVDLGLDAVMLQDRRVLGVELNAVDQLGREAVDEIDYALVLEFTVHADGGEIGRELVAQDPLHQVEVAVGDGRRLDAVGAAADVGPGADQVLHVFAQFVDRATVGGRADDEASGRARFGAQLVERALQSLALFVSADLARDADVIDRRHVDYVTARQRHVRGDAGAFLADRLFGDLDDDLLPFAQKVGDHRARKAVYGAGQRRTGERRRLLLFISLFVAALFDAQGGLRRRRRSRSIGPCPSPAAPTATARGHFTPARTLANFRNRISQLIHCARLFRAVLLRRFGRGFARRLGRVSILRRVRTNRPIVFMYVFINLRGFEIRADAIGRLDERFINGRRPLGDRFDLSGLDVHPGTRLLARLDVQLEGWFEIGPDAGFDIRFNVQFKTGLKIGLGAQPDIVARLGIVADALESQFARNRAAQAADQDFRRRLNLDQRGAALLLANALGDARLNQRVFEHLAFDHGRVVIHDAFQRLVMNDDVRRMLFIAFRRSFQRFGAFGRIAASAAARAAAAAARIILFRFRPGRSFGCGLGLPDLGRGGGFLRLRLLLRITQPSLAALARAQRCLGLVSRFGRSSFQTLFFGGRLNRRLLRNLLDVAQRVQPQFEI